MDDGRATTLGLFFTAVVIGGANFIAVRYSNQGLDPFWGAGLRFALAGTIFVIIALALRLRWPRGRLLALTCLYAFLNITLFYALMYWALLQVTGGLAAVVLAVVPLITALLSALQRLERLTARAVAGAVLALAGILWITIGQDDLVVPLGGLMALVAAGFVVAQSVIVGKKVADNHPVMTNAVGMAFAAPLLLGISLVAGEEWAAPTTTQARWALVYLCTIGSVGLFIVVLLVIRRWTANASAYVFVLIPIVTLLLEAWLLDVPLTVRAVTGALLVMTGVWFGALSAPDLSADAEVSPRGRSPRR